MFTMRKRNNNKKPPKNNNNKKRFEQEMTQANMEILYFRQSYSVSRINLPLNTTKCKIISTFSWSIDRSCCIVNSTSS